MDEGQDDIKQQQGEPERDQGKKPDKHIVPSFGEEGILFLLVHEVSPTNTGGYLAVSMNDAVPAARFFVRSLARQLRATLNKSAASSLRRAGVRNLA